MKRDKQPSLFRQMIAIHYEQAKRRKALRQLAKAEWSMEFLTQVVVNAAKALKQDIVIELETKHGHKMKISSIKGSSGALETDDSIFNKLDNEAAVQQFILEHQPRR